MKDKSDEKDEEEGVSSYWLIIRNRDDIGN
jgi:hypothetical protein